VQEIPFGPISLQLLDARPIEVDEGRDYSYRRLQAELENSTSEPAGSDSEREAIDFTEPVERFEESVPLETPEGATGEPSSESAGLISSLPIHAPRALEDR
jgi:hypothetical protein